MSPLSSFYPSEVLFNGVSDTQSGPGHCFYHNHHSKRGGGPPTVLHQSIAELHHGSHDPVSFQAAPKPCIVPKQLLSSLHGQFSSVVRVWVVGTAQAVVDPPGLQALLDDT